MGRKQKTGKRRRLSAVLISLVVLAALGVVCYLLFIQFDVVGMIRKEYFSPESSASVPDSSGEPSSQSPASVGDAVFVGDSLTVGFALYGLAPAEDVYADAGLNLDTVYTRRCVSTSEGTITILEALAYRKPEKVYIMLGTNGVAWMTPEELGGRFAEFFERVRETLPEAEIFIESIPPVTSEKEKKDPNYSNETIAGYNAVLSDLAESRKAVFVDVNEALRAENGALRTEYAADDGLHLSRVGCEALFDCLRGHE